MVTDRLCLEVDLARCALASAYTLSRLFTIDDAIHESNYGGIMQELDRWDDRLQDALLQLRECKESFASAHYSGGHDHV